MVGFSSGFLFLVRKREAVTQIGTGGIDHLTLKRTQGAGIVKGWETVGAFQILSRKTRITLTRALYPPNN